MFKSFDENKMLIKREINIAMPYRAAVESDIKVKKVSDTAEFDIDSINERLGAGDKDALKELEAQKISYSLIENANGYTVKYSYEGNNYTIVYFAPETPVTDDGGAENTGDTGNVGGTEETDAPSDVDEPDAPVTPEEPEETEEPDFVFDYSSAGVDEDVKAEDLYNEDKVENRELKFLDSISNVDSDADAGGWDDLFAELEKMKPQLKEYMKQQLEKYGFVYDEETADKLLNQFITEAVEALISDTSLRNFLDKHPKYKAQHEPLETVEDLINYIKDKLDLTKEETGSQYNMSSLVDKNETPYANKWYLDLFENTDENKEQDNMVAINVAHNSDYSVYLDEGEYLLETADYFLTEDEKELKKILEMVRGYKSGPGVTNKDEAIEYIDKYAEYLRKVLGHRYGLMPTEEFNQVFNNIVSSFKSGDALEPNDAGIIIISEMLQKFDKQVEEEIQKAYLEYLENS